MTNFTKSKVNRFKVGDPIVVDNGTEFTGAKGIVEKINGEYHYVLVQYDGQSVEMELYRNEMNHMEKSQ